MSVQPTEKHQEEAREIVSWIVWDNNNTPTSYCSCEEIFCAHWEAKAIERIATALSAREPAPHRKREAAAIADAAINPEERATVSLRTDLITRITAALSARDAEIREVLEGLRGLQGSMKCWCDADEDDDHYLACLATRALYEKVQPAKESSDGA